MQQQRQQEILQEIMEKTTFYKGKINHFLNTQIFEQDSLKAKIMKSKQNIAKKTNYARIHEKTDKQKNFRKNKSRKERKQQKLQKMIYKFSDLQIE
ncbi:unnamed protein product (macronuclear) [Paramecium tetraurelia]|uniref:Uncharacterized protein n=1 Tax=Paramecium tetraurelia TaxID=5888 RepID=A0DK72_PARTE|nr:uncharacterized protein GSPATT00017768001 [Paramecium tetraurelia]CAK83439.1 unnamed protein product [Paramecium tetraurelia]|eukprot:XP_001450836.1 hypothetical protein (macronuclear) [Paramecium tetraurelia strain d4-2]